jgi:hypothetical protein
MIVNFVPYLPTVVGVLLKDNKDVCQEEKPHLPALMDLIIVEGKIGSLTNNNVKESLETNTLLC